MTFAAVPNRPCAAAGTPILAISMVYISMVQPIQPSLDTARVRVSSINPRYGRVAEATVETWAKF